MTIEAFVLIRTETGHAFVVADDLRDIDGVGSSDVVTGPYDVIAKIEEATLDDVAKLVASQIHAVGRITRTSTCPVVRL